MNWIIDILAKGSSDIVIPKYDPTRFIVIRVACPVDAEISKDGKVLSSNEEVFNDSTSFGCMDLCGKNGEIKMFCIDDNADYNIKLKVTDTGRMDYSIRYFNEDATLDKEFNFTNVPITENTMITTKSDINDIKLSLDSDNDDNTDYTLTPQDYSELKLPETPRKDLLEPGYTLNMGNGGLISSITRDSREIGIASPEEAPVNEGDKYVKAALKLDIGLKRYVNNIFSPLASDIYTKPKVHVYAKLPNKMLGKSEYKLWKLEKDESSTDTVLTEIDTSHTKLNTPYFTGSFRYRQ